MTPAAGDDRISWVRRSLALIPGPIKQALRRLVPRTPNNLRHRNPALIDGDVEAALERARFIDGLLAELGLEPDGLRVLELGPGHNFGSQLLLASRGARVTLADRFLSPWDAAYHPAFYRALRARWEGPAAALDLVIESGGYDGALTLLAEPGEQLAGLADASVDLVMSGAVLEHVFDLPAVCREMARVTRPGGLAFHQIDFRWHSVGFSRPLEFLLHSEARFRRAFAREHGECGNRWRASEAAAQFRAAGFDIPRTDAYEVADPDALARFLPRLRRSRSPYRSWPEDDLRVLGAAFYLRRTDDPAVRVQGTAEIEALLRRKSDAAGSEIG